jgi:5-methylcytosine-specific restriction endonuclease McrA
LAHPGAHREIKRQWNKANPGVALAAKALRRIRLARASVSLLPIETTIVRAFYDTAVFLTQLTGRSFHVDHIVPISRGGLHHPRNLQVLRGVDNLKKGARL